MRARTHTRTYKHTHTITKTTTATSTKQFTDDNAQALTVSAALRDAGYEKVKMYLTFSTRVYNDMCSNPNPGLGTYRILYRNSQYLS